MDAETAISIFIGAILAVFSVVLVGVTFRGAVGIIVRGRYRRCGRGG